MTQVLYGDRIGRQGKLRIGTCAVILDERRERVLLTRRADDGLWCIPGGAMEAGESAEECCRREVREETGLEIRIKRLAGVYSNPHQLVIYPDGTQVQFVSLSFEAEVSGGELGLSDETTEVGFFSPAEIEMMPIHGRHDERIYDALQGSQPAIVK